MKLAVLFTLLFSAICAHAQNSRKNDPPAVVKVCGKLQHFAEVPVKNTKNTVEDKIRNLPRVTMLLYSAKDGHECCVGMSPVAQTTTGHWGAFHFGPNKLTSGLYWLVAQTNGREYKLLVRYDPKMKSDQLCHETFWELDNVGNFWKTETVTVD
jgi:hypothetical protein